MSKNNNEKAMASLMIFECSYYGHYANMVSAEEAQKIRFKAGKELVNFYSIYKNTNIQKYNCLYAFIYQLIFFTI